jgi:type IV secretory pathway TrbF-like protein
MPATNLFKRPSAPFGASAPAQTPFQKAGQVWDQRIGSATAQAANWRYAAFASFAITLVVLCAYIWERADTRIATYVVPVDTYGRPGRIELAGRVYQPTAAETGYFLADWVRWVRARSPVDPVVNTDNLRRAYGFVADGAVPEMADLGSAAIEAAKKDVGSAVAVEVKTVIQRSPQSYQVQWSETAFRQGEHPSTTHWTGLFSTRIQPPRDEAQLRANPLGLFISDFHISQELGQ